MKGILMVLTLLIVSCENKQSNYKLPSFESNGSISKVWDPIQDIVITKDFSIVYSEGGGAMTEPSWLTHKLFCLNGDIWEKIEIKRGIKELDTTDTELGVVEKDITLRKECSKEDVQKFLDGLIHLGLFNLADETELLKKCKEARSDHNVPRYHDVGSINFYIIKGDQVRALSYSDPIQRQEDCPNMKEWDNILKLKDLFENEWYVKDHY